jgi:ketosteroid isomerase-like protein
MKMTKVLAGLLVAWISLSATASFAQKSPDPIMNEKIVRQYYTAYEKKDWPMLKGILADNFTFTSPAGDDHISLKVYHERCWPNAANTKKFDLEQVMIAGDEALVTYNGWTNDGRLFRNTELFKLKAGKIVSNECFFGTGVSFPNNQEKK